MPFPGHCGQEAWNRYTEMNTDIQTGKIPHKNTKIVFKLEARAVDQACWVKYLPTIQETTLGLIPSPTYSVL